jgi:RND family efflux transporter MFP subunit
MRLNRKWGVIALTVLVAPTGLYFLRSDAAPMPEEARRTARVQRGTLHQTTMATGVIRPVVGAEINVGSRISGTVVRLPVKIGDRVEAGQLLAELDSATLVSAVEQAQADMELARSRLAQVESTLDRKRRLTERELLSTENLEIAVRDVAVERAQLRASEARLRSAQTVLGYSQIHAPICGVIAEVSTREGETVAAGFSAPTFVTILDLDRLEVLAYIDETDIGRMYVGQQATFTVDTYPGVEFAAKVVAIQPKAQIQGGVVNYIARLDFESNSEHILRPEMTTHMRLQLGERAEALTIPRAALRRRQGQEYVVVKRDGTWVEQEVNTGWRSNGAVEVLSGLQEGEVLELNS